jgi:DNA-directed RNA polymerase specialized sigma24 family protein
LLRREKRQPGQFPGAGELNPPAAEDDPAVRLVKDSERESVRAALVRLRAEETPLNCRLVGGRYIEGRPVKELAATEGLTPNEVSCRLRRMLAKLRAWLVAEEEE